ncbi:hypothetical protein CUJ83_02735 [Methanocella sp. CWC-04]|uniref:histidine kinase n=1 Tax=Methanooceanicella nereidis TaxID=2052831 RepID=A0AAP2RAR8_9EURY|nr:PAS domain S-box protein [Methanocella sp. CWC-04]MCD1293913.1 hypothetical protein [Methanocella sp. CWC-04]
MFERISSQKNKFRLIILGSLLLLCILLTIYVNIYLGIDIVFTHLFYIPIILAGLWYRKKAIYVALFLGLFHVISNVIISGTVMPNSLIRAIIFVIVAVVVGSLSERKDLLYDKLNESHRMLSNIIEFYPDATLIIDNNHNVVAWNKAMEDMTGVQAGDMMGKGDHEYSVPFYGRRGPMLIDLVDLPDEELTKYKYVYKADGKLECPSIKARLKGKNVYLHGTATKLCDKEGNFIGAIESLRDITEKRLAEEALMDALKRFEAIFENTPLVAIQGFDKEGTILHWNTASKDLYGYKVEEVIGRKMQDILICPDQTDTFEKTLGHIVRTGESSSGNEWKVLTKAGKQRWVYSSIFPIFEHGSVVEVYCMDVDITDRRNMEEELRRARDQLEIRVEERTAELARARGTLQTILDTVPIGVVVAESNTGKISYFTNCAKDLFDIPAFGYAEDMGPTSYELLNPDGSPVHPEDLPLSRSLYHGEYINNKEVVICHKDGRRLTVLMSSAPVIDKDGRIMSAVSSIVNITKRKEAQEELEFKSLLLDSATDSVFVHDFDGKIIYVNEAAYKTRGYTREELLGMKLRDILTEDYKKLIRPRMESLFTTGRAVYESAHLKKDGTVMPVEVHIQVVNIKGRMLYASIVRDVTELKRVDNALRESEAKYRELVQNANSIILRMDPAGNIIFFNEFAQSFFGYNEEEIMGKNVIDTIVPETDTFGRNLSGVIRNIISHPEQYQYNENENIRKNGERVWVAWTNKAIFDETGKVSEIICIGTDITGRKKAEEELYEKREMLQLVIDNIPQSIFWKDLNSVYLGCNTNFAKVSGIGAPENIAGKTDFDLAWSKDEAITFRTYDRRVMDSDRPEYNIIVKVRQADGKKAWLDINKIPLHDKWGNVIGMLGTHEDITERKRAEEALREAKSQVELYLDLMSHDINNMNQAGMGYLEMALEKLELSEEDRLLLIKSLDSLKNSSQLIENVRKIQMVKEGEIKSEIIDAGELLKTISEEYSHIHGKDVTINYVHRPGFKVLANVLLKDVFENLVWNAIKHSADSVTIDINITKIYEDGKKYYKFIIEDNGPGISDEMKEIIFTRLQRGKTKATGKGIGLYLVKTLVEEFNGRVWVEDRVPGDHGKGSKFVVIVPAAYEENVSVE